jgi:hypothetical protein
VNKADKPRGTDMAGPTGCPPGIRRQFSKMSLRAAGAGVFTKPRPIAEVKECVKIGDELQRRFGQPVIVD